MKMAEIMVMVLAIFAFSSKSVWGCYSLLFVLSIHSAMFGPSKYGIIPELVPSDSISRANGLITSCTYLAIIIGTFLASFLTEVTGRRFILIALFCLAIAIAGFFSALAIKPTTAQASKKKINLLFLREIFLTLKYARTVPHLLPAIFGSSFFLLIGAFTQLNIIPFAIQSLNFSEIAGGYLFLATALGIAFGSILAGRASRKRAELGLPCLAGFGIGVLFILLTVFSHHLYTVIACLIGIGVLGGAFIVPFDTFIQMKSDDEKRGQTIAATNFLSFTGVLFASLGLYFLNQVCSLSSAASFSVIGILTLLVTIALSLRLSDLSMSYFSRKIYRHFVRFSIPQTDFIENSKGTILILEKATWKNALLLSGSVANLHFLIPHSSKNWKWYHPCFYSIHRVDEEYNTQELLKTAQSYTERGLVPCLMLDQTHPTQGPSSSSNAFLDFFKRSSQQILLVRPTKDARKGSLTFKFDK